MSNHSEEKMLNYAEGRKQILSEIQSIKDLCQKVSSKIADFSKFEIYDNDVQIRASEQDKIFLNQMIGKFTVLSNSKNIENFIDIKKFVNLQIKDNKSDKKNKKDKAVNLYKDKYTLDHHLIENKYFMVVEELNEFDIENGINIKKLKEYRATSCPDNMLELQENGIKFYYCFNTHNNYKNLYLYFDGKSKNYWIGTDNNLYYVDHNNNLVVGATWSMKS